MIVVTDTSVVLNICFLRLESLLPRLFGAVLAPPEVRAEFQRLATHDDRYLGLLFPTFIDVTSPARIPEPLRDMELDAGERAALALALERAISVVLIDEKDGRFAAVALGLKPFGLLGILLEARRQSLIGPISPLLDQLQIQARFWIRPSLRAHTLRLADEAP